MNIHSKIQNLTSVSLPKLSNCSKSSTASFFGVKAATLRKQHTHPRPALGPAPSFIQSLLVCSTVSLVRELLHLTLALY